MRLAHRLAGPPEAPVLVLSNSLGTDRGMWGPQIDALRGRFRLLTYDQLGHGASDAPPGPYSMELLGSALLELLDELGVARASLCGVSLGGMVGMWLGRYAPERIDRLVLCCTSAHLPPAEAWRERAALVRRDGTAAVADAVVDRWFTAAFQTAEPAVVRHYRDTLLATDREGYAACCEAIAAWDFRAQLGGIAAPTLVVAGADDPATPPPHGAAIAEGVRDGRLVVLPRAAHLANLEQPDAFDQALLHHLDAGRGSQ